VEIVNLVSDTIPNAYVAVIPYSSFVSSLTVTPRFLLVSLNITAMLDQTTINQRCKQLKPTIYGRGPGDIYGVTLHRIQQSGGKVEAPDGSFNVDL